MEKEPLIIEQRIRDMMQYGHIACLATQVR